jgi:hypothetical protein
VSSPPQVSSPLWSPGSPLWDQWALYRSAASVHLAELQLLQRIGTRGGKAAAPLRRLRVLHGPGLSAEARTGSEADLGLAGEARTGSEADLLRDLGNNRVIAGYVPSAASQAYTIHLPTVMLGMRPHGWRGEGDSWQRPLARIGRTLGYSRIDGKHASLPMKRSPAQRIAPFLVVRSPQNALSTIAALQNARSATMGQADLKGFSAIGTRHRVSLLRSPTAPVSRLEFGQSGAEVGPNRSEAEIGLLGGPAGTLGLEQAGRVQGQNTASTEMSGWTDTSDREAFGDWIVGVLADKAAQPPNGYTGADPRLGPMFPGAFGRTW